jgi:hypothetical protein
MKLRTIDGRLPAGSLYRLFVTAWIVGCGAIFIPFLVLFTVGVGLSGKLDANGEMVSGAAMLPHLAMLWVTFPLAIVAQGFLLGGLMVFGVWLYQKRRPIEFEDLSTPK